MAAVKDGSGCHVCSRRKAVYIYRDESGFALKVCESTACTEGYTYERTIKRREEKVSA